VWIGIYLYG